MANGLVCHRDHCSALIQREFRDQLDGAEPDVARLSLLLGAAEVPLTCKDSALQQWPANLEVCLDACILIYWMAGKCTLTSQMLVTKTVSAGRRRGCRC